MNQENQNYDVIVIGAGNGGLMASAFASKAGLKTLTFEKHNSPGGSASSFRRGRFEFEISLHEMAMYGTKENHGSAYNLFEKLGAKFNSHVENTTYRVISTDPNEKYDAKMPCGIENFCNEVENQVPGSKESVKNFFDYIKNAVDLVDKLSPPNLSKKDIPELFNLLRLVSYSSERVMDLFKIPKKAQHIISTYWPYVGEPTNTMNAFMMGMMDYIYINYGPTIPKMTSHEISLAIEKVIRENSGQILYNTKVDEILVKNQKAYGVVANGKTYFAKNIICNAYPNDIFGKMIKKSQVPQIELKRINARPLALSFFTVYLGLNKSAQELGIKDYTVFLQEKSSPKEQFELSHSLGGRGWIIVNCLNLAVPDCTPNGTCQLSFTTSVYGDEWKNIKVQDYKKTKLKLAQEMIDYYEKTLNVSIKPFIEEIEVASPVSFARFLGSPNGTPYGYQTSNWDGIFPRTILKKKEKTIENLYFVGAYTEGSLGYNQTYKSGYNAVEEILKNKAKKWKLNKKIQ